MQLVERIAIAITTFKIDGKWTNIPHTIDLARHIADAVLTAEPAAILVGLGDGKVDVRVKNKLDIPLGYAAPFYLGRTE